MVYPVRVLRAEATALEAAMVVCLAEPKVRSVHDLRRATRKVEAQIELLEMVEGLPRFEKQADKFRKAAKKVRRAAGAVRDVDVQRELIGEFKRVRVAERNEFDEALHVERERLAAELRRKLQKRQEKLALAIEKLMTKLESAEGFGMPVKDLIRLTREWFTKSTGGLELESVDGLHGYRKAAKTVRYMAESAAGSVQAKATAKEFKRMQEAGGEWHDLLMLAESAAKVLGEKSALTQAIVSREKLVRRRVKREIQQEVL